jgi:hypothetical protein
MLQTAIIQDCCPDTTPQGALNTSLLPHQRCYLKGRDRLGGLALNGKVLFKWTFEKCEAVAWIQQTGAGAKIS